jgi:hypothetical protein
VPLSDSTAARMHNEVNLGLTYVFNPTGYFSQFVCRVHEMAAEFPHVDFTSVDTVPLVPHTRCANILSYEVYDLYNGIAEEDEMFDIVHLRYAMSKVSLALLHPELDTTWIMPHLIRCRLFPLLADQRPSSAHTRGTPRASPRWPLSLR